MNIVEKYFVSDANLLLKDIWNVQALPLPQ